MRHAQVPETCPGDCSHLLGRAPQAMTPDERIAVARHRLSVDCVSVGECLEWYGTISISIPGEKRETHNHRVAWRVSVGPIPHGLVLLWRCRNRACVRIDHLFLASRAEYRSQHHPWIGRPHSEEAKAKMRKPKRPYTKRPRPPYCKVCNAFLQNRKLGSPLLCETHLRSHDKTRREANGYRYAQIEKRTGWTREAFEAAWESQCGLCACCGKPMRPHGNRGDSVHRDHDHATGVPRALVHSACNRLVGLFERQGRPDVGAYLDRYTKPRLALVSA
jgi:hypothetical protein